MKEIVIRTLAGLGPGFGRYGYCDACGRMERLERKALIRALGWDAEPALTTHCTEMVLNRR